MKVSVQDTAAIPARLATLRPLLGELMDLKRVRTADHPDGLAARGFRRAWAALVAGVDLEALALRETALALVAVRLGGIDAALLARAGLPPPRASELLHRALDAAASPLEPGLRERLHAALSEPLGAGDTAPPPVVERLVRQPRAGITHPGRPRILLETAESHADHCYAVAVASVLVAPLFDAAPALPFVAGLSHHLFNGVLPDSGHAADVLLGDAVEPMVERLTEEVLATLPAGVATRIREARRELPRTDTPESRAFHAADVLDRVLEMDFHARAARFTLRQVLEHLELVHAGPMQSYENAVLVAAGLRA
ncbi:HD domain-containing protein [Myxococcus sp. AM001]|nr:HD domain-containing protein [Myxococcus sp. AM001]